MKKAAVVIDSWKLEVFKEHLLKAGYSYTILPGITADTLTIQVSYAWVHQLKPVIEAAQLECARQKAKGG